MTLRPATLTGRTVLLVFAAVLLAEIASSTLLFHVRREGHVQQVADLIANAVEMSRLALEVAPPAERLRMVRNAGEGPGLQPPQARPPLREPQRHVGREIARFVRERLGEDTPIRLEPPPSRALWVGFIAAGERWWLVMPGPRLEPVPPWRALALLGGVTALIALLAALYARHVARPLRALADATRSLGEGRPRPVQPAGPAEVRTVALNFNAMLEQLQTNERERAVMLAGLPHDLRAPLARMKLRLAMLDDAEARDGLTRDCAAIEHLATQFVAYLRGLQSGALNMQRLNLAHLVRESVARYAAAGSEVRIVDAEDGDILGDRAALARLLDNLIANGTTHGAPPVELAVRQRGECLELAVRDHGPGIPPDQRARALEAFVQLHSERQTEGACGLGLAIVDRIARAHGAELVLGQAQPQGLLVEIRFPLAAAAA